METPQASKPEEKTKPKNLKTAAIVAGTLLVALIIFAAGVGVGLRKARFSYRWGENYERNFMGSRFNDGRGMMGGRSGFLGGMMREFSGRDFRNAHGLSGTIISITDNNLIVKDRDGKENTVAVTDKTVIKNRRDNLTLNDLKPNDQVVIIGNPADNGVINADLIRMFDNPINN